MSFRPVEHLLEAIQQGRLNKLISLVQHGYNIRVKNKLEQNLLFYVLQQQRLQLDSPLTRKRLQIFKHLIAQYNLDAHAFDSYGKNLFNWAANLNCTAEALHLLSAYPGDVDILIKDQCGSCSLHYAVEHGNETLVHAIVNYLLRYRLRFDVRDAFGNTPEDLARKLGYEKIGHFLAQASRSTIYMTREMPVRQAPASLEKTKPTKKSSTRSTLSEYFNMIEMRVHEAKSFDDWSTVAALRAYRRDFTDKKSNRMSKCQINPTHRSGSKDSLSLCLAADSLPEPGRKPSSIPTLPKIVTTDRATGNQSEEMLRLFELHLSPSFRRQYVPLCHENIIPSITLDAPPNGANLAVHLSPLEHRPSLTNLRQPSPLMEHDEEHHLPVPPVAKQHRKSIVAMN